MKVSIVIRTFNSEGTIGKVLERIREQTFRDYEVVIVDSGSTDGTLDVARKHSPYSLVEYSQRRFTYSGSLNAGFEAARGESVVCLSSHCIPLDRDWLGQLVETLDSDECLAGAWGPLVFDANVGAKSCPAGARDPEVVDLEKFRGRPTWGLQNANGIVRRELWRERPFSEKVKRCEDQDWAYHFLRKGYVTAMVHDAPVHYAPNFGFIHHAVKAYRDSMALYRMFGYKGPGTPFEELYRETKWFYRVTRRGDKSLQASKLAVSSRVGRWAADRAINLRERVLPA